jgi:hemolysin activation/secretion protein
VFTKGFFWADWVQPLGHGFTIKIAANGQLADRPLLAAQEIGLGGPSFGRAYDFSERFGDSGFMASGEFRWRRSDPLSWIDWVEPYVFADTGRVWNLDGGYGGGDLTSAGGGVRAALGRLQLSVEAAVPVASPRAATGNKRPRLNVSIGRRF